MHIVIDGIPMDEDAKLILSELDTLEKQKDFYPVFYRMRSVIQAGVYVEEFIENTHNEFVGEQRVDVVGRKKRKNIVRKKKGVVPCDGHCNRVFKSRWNMKRHPDARKLIKCEYCTTFYFRGKRNLRTHMKKMHEKYLKTLKCNKCENELKGEKSLSMHMKMHDPNYGMFECVNCKLFFTQKHSMERHRRNFHK
jgi:hypothetical protein